MKEQHEYLKEIDETLQGVDSSKVEKIKDLFNRAMFPAVNPDPVVRIFKEIKSGELLVQGENYYFIKSISPLLFEKIRNE